MSNGNAEAIGPIDYVLLEFPDQDPSGETAGALMDLVDAGIIRVFDIVAIRKGNDGEVSGFEVSDLTSDGAGSFAAFTGARTGLAGEEDIAEAAAAMEPGTVAVLLVYENAWAAPFVAAARQAGGEVIASARIPAQFVLDALDALDEN